ncbi:MAG: 50S ribosomal protein L23 [Panacagrimonas sp.]
MSTRISVDRLHQVLVAPLVSEKSTNVAENCNTAVFKVLPDANKAEIKAAVEALFKVQVTGVNTLNVRGKTKRFGRSMGRRSDWKKAYVTLAKGEEIDFLSGATA